MTLTWRARQEVRRFDNLYVGLGLFFLLLVPQAILDAKLGRDEWRREVVVTESGRETGQQILSSENSSHIFHIFHIFPRILFRERPPGSFVTLTWHPEKTRKMSTGIEMLTRVTFRDWEEILSSRQSNDVANDVAVETETDYSVVTLNGLESLESLEEMVDADEAYPSSKRMSHKNFAGFCRRINKIVFDTGHVCFLCGFHEDFSYMVDTARGKPICLDCCIEVEPEAKVEDSE